ncbi:hypothetical protein MYSTI_07298 [Myxococcus stipitatus DSM 14675]|uniref:Uncharacterized protein n=1 Tax=Myxococcus stipitatus (strain DSM 14675 / JCM 12634 / Mx s8) TaxID=1278073 RepID=L7UKZ8_MYXSD|nr:hypothetical protein [Myxococcus stipitatus]AGC48570.1 hypothetical protein MYSTI_07298 [Myxococcus stipitatus DSM 14675]
MKFKLSRFLHLENDRGERAKQDAPAQLQDGGRRFEDLAERASTPQGNVVPEAHLERFKAQAPLVLEHRPDLSEDALDFPRCLLCDAENGRYAKTCQRCEADLHTPQQLEHKARLTRERQQARDRRASPGAEAASSRLEDERREDAKRYEYLMGQLRAQEQKGSGWHLFRKHASLGTGLLALLPSPFARGVAVTAYLGVTLGLLHRGQGGVRIAGLVLAGLFLVLLIPIQDKPRRRRWW